METRQAEGGARPPCYNRAPAPEGRWYGVGRRPSGKLILRWFRSPFADRCATWDGDGIGKYGEPYPLAHGFAGHCLTCRWRPTQRVAEALVALSGAMARAGA